MSEARRQAEDLDALVARIRKEALAAGEIVESPSVGPIDLDEDVRAFLVSILEDGSYAEASAEIARRDPDLAND